jgi:polar amino acid transport system permease protein
MLASGINILFEGKNMVRLMSGLAVTVKIALIAVVLSLVFGVIFGIIMTSRNFIVKAVCRLYLEAIRIIPILVWLFLFYFGLTRALGIHLEGEFISIVVFTMWGTAEMGDIVRGAVTSMPKHQTESTGTYEASDLPLYFSPADGQESASGCD